MTSAFWRMSVRHLEKNFRPLARVEIPPGLLEGVVRSGHRGINVRTIGRVHFDEDFFRGGIDLREPRRAVAGDEFPVEEQMRLELAHSAAR